MCLGGYLWGCIDCDPFPNVPKKTPKKLFVKSRFPVPLTGVQVDAKIVDFCAEVTMQQRYENVESVPIEATYVFPLREKASVCSFYAIVDGKRLDGILKEKEKARDMYDDAIASGHSAYLLEEVDDQKNMFKANLGNIPPNSEVVVVVVYVTELEVALDNMIKFVLQTNTKAFPDGIENKRFLKPQYGITTGIAHGLKINLSLEMASNVANMTSNHPITFTVSSENPHHATAELAKEDIGTPLLEDFEVLVHVAESAKPVLRVQDNTAMLAFCPTFSFEDEDEVSCEIIFVVDRSGSMSGRPIERVKETMQIFLRSLPFNTRFNIVGFGANHVKLFPASSVQYDDNTLATATEHVTNLKANLGGTDILGPLKAILAQPTIPGVPRQLFLLTDGEVSNTQQCISYAQQHANTTRIFTFGIGQASPALVQGLAKAGSGFAEIIGKDEAIEVKVLAQLKRALQPALTDIQLKWAAKDVKQTPAFFPPLFSGNRVVIYGYSESDIKGTVTFTAQSTKGPVTFTFDITKQETFPGNFIPKLAARSMINDLQENRSYLHNADGTLKPRYAANAPRDEALKLSLKSGVISKYTAFIVINKNNKAVDVAMETRDINEQQRQNAKSQQVDSFDLLSSIKGRPRLAQTPAPKARSASPTNQLSNALSMSLSSRRSATFDDSEGDNSSDDEWEDAPVTLKEAEEKSAPVWGSSSGSSTKKSLFSRSKTSSGPPPPPPPPPGDISGPPPPPPGGFSGPPLLPGRFSPQGAMSDYQATESVPKPPSGAMQQQKIQKDYIHSLPTSSSTSTTTTGAAPAPARKMMSFGTTKPLAAKAPASATPPRPSPSSSVSSSPSPSATPSAVNVVDIVMKQKAAGNFTADVLALLDKTLAQIRTLMTSLPQISDMVLLENIVITTLVCEYLEKKFADKSSTWDLVVKKAKTWIKRVTKDQSELAQQLTSLSLGI